MTRLHTINYWRLRHRENIRIILQGALICTLAALCLFGAYSSGDYAAQRVGELDTLRKDNQVAMQMLSGDRFMVDGSEYRMEEVKQKQLIGGL